jgi:hypothetical protein
MPVRYGESKKEKRHATYVAIHCRPVSLPMTSSRLPSKAIQSVYVTLAYMHRRTEIKYVLVAGRRPFLVVAPPAPSEVARPSLSQDEPLDLDGPPALVDALPVLVEAPPAPFEVARPVLCEVATLDLDVDGPPAPSQAPRPVLS